jgi:hypothetical protein
MCHQELLPTRLASLMSAWNIQYPLSAAMLLGLMFCTRADASPADYVYVPAVERGEREIEVQYGTASPSGGNSAQASNISFGYGMEEFWFTEVYLKTERSGNTDATLTEWENKFQLTETGKYPVDLGFVIELEAQLSGSASWDLRFGPLLQLDIGSMQLNGNLLFDHPFGATDGGVNYSTNIGYQWQSKYRWQRVFEFGLQGMGEMGQWNSTDNSANQNHRAGPAVFGKFPLGGKQTLKYNAAWLFGLSAMAPGHTLRSQIEYEF